MKVKLHLLALALGTLSMIGCEKDDNSENTAECEGSTSVDNPIEPSAEQRKRKVLLEMFSAVGGSNCPAATEVALSIENEHPEEFIIVSMHAGWFSSGAGNPTSFDLTAEDGETYYTEFVVQSTPVGMINRKSTSSDLDQLLIGSTEWQSATEDFLTNSADAAISIASQSTFDASSRSVDMQFDVQALEGNVGDFRLVAYLVEDRIIGKQIDSRQDPQQVDNYEHRHVFRDAITDIWGKEVFAGDAEEGETDKVVIQDYAIDQAFDVENCSMVVYVYNEATQEVLQAEIFQVIQ